MSSSQTTRQVLWAGNLGQATFEERLDAAVASGFAGVSVFPWDCRPPGDTHSRAAELRVRAESQGLRLVALDPLTTWLPAPSDRGSSAGARTMDPARAQLVDLFNEYSTTEVLEMACQLGAEVITVIEPYGVALPAEIGAEALAEVCNVARPMGLRLQVEFMPFSGIPDLASAWEIVRLAGKANAGLVLDSWHFFRSSGCVETVSALPSSTLFSIQLSDGPPEPETDLWQGNNARLLPGWGSFDFSALFRSLGDRHPDALLGPEVISSALNSMPPREAARLAADATASILLETGQDRGSSE